MKELRLPALIYFISLALLVASLVFQLAMVHSDFYSFFHSASNVPNNWDGVIVVPLILFGIAHHILALCFAPKEYPWWPGIALILAHVHFTVFFIIAIPMLIVTKHFRSKPLHAQ